ncbi:hypothetical protein H8784_17705 [Parabacteroides acidifaciens]|uniref:DUF6383 domain-containing protein n=1 Tax=Parabacteroides acidifaciens TaxID=2290935 RepID=A0A3D8HAH9_9BACT|nr:DUF6383 domain-containing protein [Parabacteroides acidifaciens]MBC8603549.1 hypothetical protein [Parabacteroides acidifaciens]RDU47740.1 hypothetical protein DWU89_18140 [Parabacteroides acidifaciens]
MNKKFSTLVAAALVVSGFANAETWDAPKPAEVAKTVATGNYYHIGASDGANKFFLTIKKNDEGKFYLYAKTVETGASMAASTDSALWEPIAIKTQAPYPAAYTFKNKFTGKTLAVKYAGDNKDQTAVLVDPEAEGAISSFTWLIGDAASDTALVAYDAQNKPYVLDLPRTSGVVKEGAVTFVKGTDSNMKDLGARPYTPAEIYMTAEMLNEELNGSFKLNVLGNYTDKSKDPMINEFIAYKSVSTDDQNNPAGVFLQVKGKSMDREHAPKVDGKYQKNNNVFLVVDTTFIPGVAQRDSVNPKGLFLTYDSIQSTNGSNVPMVSSAWDATAWNADSAAVGRLMGSYRFFIYKNISKVDADSLIIKVDSLPSIGTEKTGNSFSNPATPPAANAPKNAAFLANYVIGTGNTPVFTALDSAVVFEANQQNYQLPYITLGDGIKANLPEGIYSIQKKNGGFYQARLVYGDNYATMLAYDSAGVKACKEVPYTQWRFSGSKGRYSIENRENGATFKDYMAVKTLYTTSTADEYKYGDETLIIKPIADVDEDDAFLGYKHFTAEELDNLAVRLRFTAFGGVENLYVVANRADSLLHVRQIEDVTDAIEFKLKAVTDAAGKDKDVTYNAAEGLNRRAYQLMVNNYGDNSVEEYLVWDKDAKAFALSDFQDRGDNAVADSAATAVIFRLNCEGQYQILPVDTAQIGANNFVGFKADSLWTMGHQLTVIGSNDLLVGSDVNELPTGYFVLDVPEAPKYTTVETGHYRVQSVNNTSLAITTNADGAAVLRGVGESMLKSDPAYAANNFILYIDSACTHDAAMPTYYISTTQATSGVLTPEDTIAGARYYMMNTLAADGKGNAKKLVFAKAKQPFETGDTLVVAPYAKADTMVIGGKDGAQNRAAFAFQTTATPGEFKIQNVATGHYVKQVNTVISLEAGYANGNNFTLEAQETPTANEVTPSVTEVKVIAANGSVQIVGAAGKKVVITNILGQTVANTVITSSDATIAAPAGVVVVAVEGEEAVKAIVK